MSDIFREVDEEVRRSQAEDLWRRYSAAIFAACVLVVLTVAGWRYYAWTQETAAATAGARYEQAAQLIQAGKGPEGEAALAILAAEDRSIHGALARFRLAGELAKRDANGAVRAFDELAADASLNANLRDVARLRSGAAAVDALPMAETERRLSPLLSPGNVWRHHANELLAAAAVKAGDLGKARRHLDTIIIDRESPPNVKARAEVLIGLTRGAS